MDVKKKLIRILKEHQIVFAILLAGVSIRLIFALLINHEYDFFNILVLSKSVADTGSIAEGFFVVKRVMNTDVQLYGKIYYQIAAAWLHLLDFLRIVDLRYLFDNKEFADPRTYLTGFGQWAPLLYQLAAIKMIQFLFDCIYLIYSLKITMELFGKKMLPAIALFWALNLFLVYTSFGMFQSDLAMVSLMIAGVYHAGAAQKNPRSKKHIIFMLIYFALGAVIKQVPLLFVVPFLILLTQSIRSFLLYSTFFALIYLGISQSFHPDSVLMKQFFLTSVESLALFNFRLNDVPLFMAGYLVFVMNVLFFRKTLLPQRFIFVILGAIIVSIIYIFEDMRYFFVQFSVWIMPFIAFLTLKDFRFGYFFIIPVIGFFRRTLADRGVLSGSFGASMGSILSNVPSYNTVLSTAINPELVYFLLNTIQITCTGILVYILFQIASQKKKTFIEHLPSFFKFSLVHVSIILALIFSSIFFGDMIYATRHALITKYNYDLSDKQYITSAQPINFTILNPEMKPITGLRTHITRSDIFENGVTYITVSDSNGDTVYKKVIQDVSLPENEEPFYINFSQSLHNSELIVTISKDNTKNKIAIRKVTITGWGHENASNSTYDYYYKDKPVQIDFGTAPLAINVQGIYTFEDIVHHITQTFTTKPTFYSIYGAITMLLLFGAFYLAKKART